MPPTSTSLTKKEKVMGLIGFLQSKKEAIDNVCQRAVTGDVLIKALHVSVSRNPQLADCTPLSLLNALICAAEFGLKLGPAGHFYILPFWNGSIKKLEAVPVVGYKGMIELVTRDGDVIGVEARVVRMKDTFKVLYGTDPRIEHSPAMAQRGAIVGAYSIVTMPNGHKQFEFMSREELEKIKARSPLGKKNKGPWKMNAAMEASGDDNDFGEMCRKSVTRRAAKYVPIGIESADLLARADELEGDVQSITLNVEGAAEGLADRLTKAIAEQADDGHTQENEGNGNTQDEGSQEEAGDGRDDDGFDEAQQQEPQHEAAEAAQEDADNGPAQSLLDRLDA